MKTARTQKTFLLLLSLGLLMCLPFSEGPVFAADAMKANMTRMEQGDFLAGPGIAVAETESGRVQGYVRKGVYTYHGVPYAEAKERFVRAERVTPWQGVRLAVDYGAIAPQEKGSFPNTTWEDPAREFPMDNNCQNLNIWTPGIADGKKRPVMVWLHGGGFSAGSSAEIPAYDGANLSREGDVVVVSVNHRLNVLGHFDLSAYGEKYRNADNVGIYDLVDALRWVRDNIAQFGGDPANVTIFGESGGGAKVLALMTTPYAKGLFHKGIVESGAVPTMGPVFIPKEAAARVTELTLEKLGITAERIEELQTISYERLTAASNEALKQAGEEFKIPQALGTGYGMSWEPVIDGDFMPTNPVTADGFAAAGKDIPLLIGSNRTEWTNFSDIMQMEKAQSDNKNTWSAEEIDRRLKGAYGDKAEEIAAAFLRAYPQKKRADALYVDTMIRLPIKEIMDHKAMQGGAPVYAYLFAWDSPMMGGVYMSYHTAEIPFVFHNIERAEKSIGTSAEAKALEAQMSRAWIHFARTGKPEAPGMPNWDAYTLQGGATMMFDVDTKLVHHHDAELLKLLAPAQ